MKPAIYFLLILFLASCQATNQIVGFADNQAPVVIYRTTGDYYLNVPITLNESKEKILTYPDPSDLLSNGEILLPVKLKKGFLLDRRGINVHSAFTSYTYESYAALKTLPSLDELYESIIDSDPLESIYLVGTRADYGNLIKELNKRIKTGLK